MYACDNRGYYTILQYAVVMILIILGEITTASLGFAYREPIVSYCILHHA